MIWSWVILVGLSIGIVIWSVFAYRGNYDSFGASIVTAICIFIFGWILIGFTNDVNSKISKIENAEIVKTEYFILVICDDNSFKFNIKKDFDNISDTTTFYYLEGVNMYGGNASGCEEIFYYTYQDIMQKMDTIGIKNNKTKNLGKKL